jgi:hypothetical protein
MILTYIKNFFLVLGMIVCVISSIFITVAGLAYGLSFLFKHVPEYGFMAIFFIIAAAGIAYLKTVDES